MLKKVLRLPPGENNPRNSEGSFLKLKDGRIIFVYTHFYGASGGDHGAAYLAVRYSSDNGLTWIENDELFIKNEGKLNVMSPSFLRLKSGNIMLGYLIKNSLSDCQFCVCKSSDEMKTWTPKVMVTTKTYYHVVNNDRLVQLSSGRIIVPIAIHGQVENQPFYARGRIAICYSDDEGNTWEKSSTVIESSVQNNVELDIFGEKKKHQSGLQEPGLVELKDGTLLLWARTDLGCQYLSYSSDQGNTWSKPEPSVLISPCSPASIKRIPSTGDLLVVYNDHSGQFPFSKWKRTPLVIAISKDEGKTWINHKVIEDNPDGWYCYVAISFINDKILLAYCAGDKVVGRLNQTQITVLDNSFIY